MEEKKISKVEFDEAVKQARSRQLFQTIAWEAACDSSFVDSIISNESCLAGFDSEGHLFTLQERNTEDCFNLFQTDLPRILKQAFPKSNSDEVTA